MFYTASEQNYHFPNKPFSQLIKTFWWPVRKWLFELNKFLLKHFYILSVGKILTKPPDINSISFNTWISYLARKPQKSYSLTRPHPDKLNKQQSWHSKQFTAYQSNTQESWWLPGCWGKNHYPGCTALHWSCPEHHCPV